MKYVTFMVGEQLCGVDLAFVRELLGYMPFTPIVAEHPSIVGWFHLRGQGVWVLDLRIRLGAPVTRTDDTVMIVVESSGQTFAMIVDRAVGLENLSQATQLPANLRLKVDARFTTGVAVVNDQLIALLDLPQTLLLPPSLPKAA